jgi:hypothetical protein
MANKPVIYLPPTVFKQNKSLTLDTPTATEKLPLWSTDNTTIKLTSAYSVVTSSGGSPSVAWQLKYGSDFSATGTTIAAATATSQTTATVVSLSDTVINPNNFIWLTTSAAANIKYLNLTISYTDLG